MGRVKQIWYLSHMRAAKVQASKICHNGLLEDTNSLDRAQMKYRDVPVNYTSCWSFDALKIISIL